MFSILKKLILCVYRLLYNQYLNLVYRFLGIEAINGIVLRARRPKHILIKFGAQIGEGTKVYPHIHMHAAIKDYSKLIVGKNCRLMRDCFLDLTECIEIEDTAIVGIGVHVITHLNFGDSALKSVYPTTSSSVKIGKGAILAIGSIVLQGVVIGEHSVIGAGALVRRDIPPYSVVVGKVGRVVKKLNIDSIDDGDIVASP